MLISLHWVLISIVQILSLNLIEKKLSIKLRVLSFIKFPNFLIFSSFKNTEQSFILKMLHNSLKVISLLLSLTLSFKSVIILFPF